MRTLSVPRSSTQKSASRFISKPVYGDTIASGAIVDDAEFAKALAALRALRTHPPRHIGVEHVEEYHGIVDRLQTSSGHDLRQYRILNTELEYPIPCALRLLVRLGPRQPRSRVARSGTAVNSWLWNWGRTARLSCTLGQAGGPGDDEDH